MKKDYFYSNTLYKLSPSQLAEIENITLGDIFCSTSDDIKETVDNVFHLNSARIKCDKNKAKIDLRKWAESCTRRV